MDIESFMPDEEECYKLLREMRWPDGVRCVYCGSEHVVRTGRWRDTPNQRYHCRSCDKWFNDKTGTIFQDTRLPLRVWFFVAFMLQFKVSILEISKTVGINYKSAFHMVKRLRSTVYGKNISDKLRGVVEMDEAYVKAGSKGNKELNRVARKRGLKTRGEARTTRIRFQS